MALTFYHGQGSPFSWRVWLALEFKAVAYELRVLSFAAGDTTKPDFVAINPRHQVPTIVDEGFALWESAAILEYLDERFPAGPKLFPGDARNRARIRRLVLEVDEYLMHAAVEVVTAELFFKKEGEAPDMAKVEEARVAWAREAKYFAQELRGEFLGGEAPCAADFALYTAFGYSKRITVRKPESRLTEAIPEPLAAWARRIEALSYFDPTYPPHWR